MSWVSCADADAFFEEPPPEPAAPPAPKSPAESLLSPRRTATFAAGASEAEIERALYVGNYSGAVDICLEVR